MTRPGIRRRIHDRLTLEWFDEFSALTTRFILVLAFLCGLVITFSFLSAWSAAEPDSESILKGAALQCLILGMVSALYDFTLQRRARARHRWPVGASGIAPGLSVVAAPYPQLAYVALALNIVVGAALLVGRWRLRRIIANRLLDFGLSSPLLSEVPFAPIEGNLTEQMPMSQVFRTLDIVKVTGSMASFTFRAHRCVLFLGVATWDADPEESGDEVEFPTALIGVKSPHDPSARFDVRSLESADALDRHEPREGRLERFESIDVDERYMIRVPHEADRIAVWNQFGPQLLDGLSRHRRVNARLADSWLTLYRIGGVSSDEELESLIGLACWVSTLIAQTHPKRGRTPRT